MRTVKLAVAALVAALFAFPATADAQANKAQIYHLAPKQGAETGFEAALQNHAEWREKHDDPWTWHVYQIVQGKHLGHYIVRSGGHDWSEWDSYNQGFGQKAGSHYAATVAPLVGKSKAYVEAVDTALVRWPEQMEHPKLISVDTYHLKPGGGEDWYGVAEGFHEAIVQEDAEGYRYAVSYPVAGSAGWARVVTPQENWADFAPPERSSEELMNAVHGEEEAQEMLERFTNSFHSTHSMVVRYRPDLSVHTEEGSSGMESDDDM